MEIKEFIQKKTDAETRIREFISNELYELSQESGVKLSLRIDSYNTTNMCGEKGIMIDVYISSEL